MPGMENVLIAESTEKLSLLYAFYRYGGLSDKCNANEHNYDGEGDCYEELNYQDYLDLLYSLW